MVDRLTGIIAELKNNEEEIVKFFIDLNSEQLGLPVYPEDPGWNVRQVLAHLITIEGTMQWLFNDILAGGPGSPEDFDVGYKSPPTGNMQQPTDTSVGTISYPWASVHLTWTIHAPF